MKAKQTKAYDWKNLYGCSSRSRRRKQVKMLASKERRRKMKNETI